MKILKLIIKALLFGSIFVCLFPLVVYADGYTYEVISGCTHVYDLSDGKKQYFDVANSSSEIRAVRLVMSNGDKYYALVSENSFGFYSIARNASNTSACGTSPTYTQISVDNGYAVRLTHQDTMNNNTGIIPIHNVDTTNTSVLRTQAIYYTFGEGAVGPTPTPVPINWGSVRDPEYSTRIAGSGSAAKQNVDVLRWNKEYDTYGNDISECEIEIQAVPGSWSDSTLQGLLNQAVNAFNSTGVQPVTLETVSASDGLFNVSWNSIISTLNWNFDYLIARETQADLWEKFGWYYRIRLISPDGYEGQWQTLYTPLSSSAQDSETVINHNSFDMSVNQVYQNITQLNNNTSVTIVYNDTDYTIQNPDNGTEPTGGTTLWDILKELLNGIFQILAKLGDLIVGLVDGLFDLFRSLFTPPEVDQTVNNDINLNINNYITESQPGLQDQQLHLHQIFTDLETISSSYSNGGDCILTWENVSMDLSVFNAGTVTFIPGGTYDFKAAFMQLLAGFGMTYATYQMLVSGVIYILLFVLISHKVKGFLKKT